MRPAVRWGMLSCLVVMAASEASMAAPAAADPSGVEAQTRFEEGLARVKAGDFAAARVSFAQAYGVLRKPRILWNLALCEEKTGRLLDALAHFKQVARDPSTVDADRANAELHADTLASETGHVEVQAPAGITLIVDGGPLYAITPLAEPLDVTVGHHVIEARMAQGSKSLGVDAFAGQIAHLNFVSTDGPVPALAPPSAKEAPGPVAARSMSTPSPDADAAVAAPGPRIESPKEEGAISPSRVVATSVVGAAAVAALVLAIDFGVQSRSDADKAAGFRSTYTASGCSNPMGSMIGVCVQWNDVVKSQNREATASTSLYVVGGVLAAGAFATWFLWPKSRERPGAAFWVAPAIAPGMAGVGAGGVFF